MLARRLKLYKNGFEPSFYAEKLDEPQKIKDPVSIFAPSMGDMFSPGMEDEWITSVFTAMLAAGHHSYIMITKNPGRMVKFIKDNPIDLSPLNLYFGVSLTGEHPNVDFMYTHDLKCVKQAVPSIHATISLEPFIADVPAKTLWGIIKPEWVIIDALMTGSVYQALPSEWIDQVAEDAQKKKVPLFVKSHANYHTEIKQYPAGMPHKE